MADTPKSSPESPKTFGDLYTEIQKKALLTPEEENALREKVMRKYGTLGLLRKRGESISDSTRKELDDLLADLPNKGEILAKLDHLFPGGSTLAKVKEEGNKLVAQVDSNIPTEVKKGAEQISTEAKALGNKMANAIPDAPEGMKQALGKIGENTSTSTAALTAAGAAVMAAPTIEGKAKALDGVMGVLGKGWDAVGDFFAAIFAAIGALFSGKFSEALDTLKGAFGMGENKDPKTLAEKAKKKEEKGGEKAREGVENYGEKMKQKYWDSLVAEGWIKDPKAQKTKFEALWKKYSDKMKGASKETYDMVTGSKNGVLGEQIFTSSQASLSFLTSLVSDGIIPTEAIQVKIGEYGEKAIEIGLKSAKSLIMGSPMEAVNMLGQFGSSDFESLSPAQRKTILSSVHHSMAVPLYMTGLMSKLVAKTALFGIYYDHGIGFGQAGAIGYGVLGQYDASAKKMTDLLTMLGDKHVSETGEYAKMFRAIVAENQIKAQVMQTFLQMKESGKPVSEIIKTIEKLSIDQKVVSELLTDLRTSGTNQKTMIGSMTKFLETPQTKDMIGTGAKWAKSFSGTVSMTHDMQANIQYAIDESRNTGKKMASVVKSDFAPLKWWNNMRFGVSQAELMAALDKNIFPIKAKDANEAKVLMDRYVRAIPSGFETFFSGLAVSLTIADVWAAKPGEKLETLAHDIYMMNPLVGGAKMILEGTTMEGGKLTKFAYIGVGGTVFAIGAYDVARFISSPSWSGASRLALGPIHTVGATAINMVRGGRISLAAGQALLRPGALASFRTLRAFGSYAAIAGIAYLYYDYLSGKNDIEGMKSAGMIDEKGNIDPSKLKEGFAALPEEKKGGAVKHILDSMFGGEKVAIDVESLKKITVNSQRTGADGVPVGVDTLGHIREIMTSLGISDPQVFLSSTSVKNLKTYIQSLPIADDMKGKLASEYGIDLSMLG